MIDAKEAQKIRDRSGKLSFDKRCPGVVRYVEDKVKMLRCPETVRRF